MAFLLDFAVSWSGDHVSQSLYRVDTSVPVVLSDDSRKVDVLVVGGCRAGLNIDPKILGKSLGGLRVFNAGRYVIGLPTVELSTYVGLAHHNPKAVVIVVDYGNLQETLSSASVEAATKSPWLNLMSPEHRRDYESVYTPSLSRYSGLWRYRGQGREIITDGISEFMHRPIAAVDGYTPRPAEQNILATLKSDKASVLRNTVHTLNPDYSYASGVISRIVAAVKADGGRPILVVAPMHRYFADDNVNAQQFAIISDLARKNDVSLIFYPDNKSQFSQTDIYWSDQGHLNQLGAENFSRILGADLSRLLAKPGKNIVLRAGRDIDR